MADRGFDLDDCLPDGVKCQVPPFLESHQQLEPDEVVRTRRIATLHIHVERAKERVKNSNNPFLSCNALPTCKTHNFCVHFLMLLKDPLVLCLPESK